MGVENVERGASPKVSKTDGCYIVLLNPTHLIHPYSSYILLYSSGFKMPCFIPIHHIAAWNRCLTWNLEGGLSLLARGTVTWKASLQIRGTLSKSNVAMGNHPRMVNCPLSCWITRVYPLKKINKIPWTANAQVKWMRDVQPCHLCQIISCLHHTKVRAVVAGTQLNCLNVKGILWIQMVEFRVS